MPEKKSKKEDKTTNKTDKVKKAATKSKPIKKK